MVEAGHEVLALAPDYDEHIHATFAGWGVSFDTIPMARNGLNPIADLRTTLALIWAFRGWRADVLLASSAKPVVYGLIGARLARVGIRSAMIPGAGSALGGESSARQQLVSRVLRHLYRLGLGQAQIVYFQNGDDERLFRSLGLVSARQRLIRVNGSGVDLAHFALSPLPPPPITYIMVGRLIRDKGVVEYVEAARIAHRVRPELRFLLLGPLDTNPTAITATQLEEWQKEGIIEYLGVSRDVRPHLGDAHVCVLPSYHEGTPRAVLEAMSMGRPILTTDAPGCRETVRPGVNGYLVPVRDPEPLAAAMIAMADDIGELQAMGRASRSLAEERFDVHQVNRVIMDTLLNPSGLENPIE